MNFKIWQSQEIKKLFDTKTGKRKKRNYPHIGNKLNKKYIQDLDPCQMIGSEIIVHDFLPLIQIDKIARKYKEDTDTWYDKLRPITFASHEDALIFSWFNHQLNDALDKKIKEAELNHAITGYRNGIGSNIDACKRAVDFLNSNMLEKDVFLFDVSNFFGELNHIKLKNSWRNILQENTRGLSEDHYSVYKAVTKARTIHINEIKIILNKSKISQIMKLPKLCQKNDLKKPEWRSSIQKWISKGIPQGLPISGVLANIYMFDFDKEMNKIIKNVGGYYSRYSDDIFIALPKGIKIEEIVYTKIKDLDLEIKKAKTDRMTFIPIENRFIDENNKPKNMTYLGFRYDGKNTYISEKTISRFISNMKNSIRTQVFTDIRKYKRAFVKRNNIYKRFSNINSYAFGNYVKQSGKVFGNQINKQVQKISSPQFIKDLIKEETQRQKTKMISFTKNHSKQI